MHFSSRASLLYIVSALFLFGCSAHSEAGAPSENSSLNAISPTQVDKPKPGYMQQAYDKWEKDEWAPNTKKAEKQASDTNATVENNQSLSKESNASDTFKLQNYVNKWKLYHENTEKNESDTPSNTDKLNTLPVIGN
jgi:hypothetical protein